jgi:hypothetical protein
MKDQTFKQIIVMLFLMACAGTVTGYAQDATNPAEVKFRFFHIFASDYYLSETGYDHFKVDRSNPTTFGLEPVGARPLFNFGGNQVSFCKC